MPEHQRFSLRALAGQELRQLLRVCLLQRVEFVWLFRSRQPLYHALRAVFAERLDQQPRGNILSADCDEVLCRHHLLVFLQHVERYIEWNQAKSRDLVRHALQIVVRQIAQNRCRRFISKQRKQNRCLACAGQC